MLRYIPQLRVRVETAAPPQVRVIEPRDYILFVDHSTSMSEAGGTVSRELNAHLLSLRDAQVRYRSYAIYGVHHDIFPLQQTSDPSTLELFTAKQFTLKGTGGELEGGSALGDAFFEGANQACHVDGNALVCLVADGYDRRSKIPSHQVRAKIAEARTLGAGFFMVAFVARKFESYLERFIADIGLNRDTEVRFVYYDSRVGLDDSVRTALTSLSHHSQIS